MISDLQLITAAHPTTKSPRRYLAVYLDGRTVGFAVQNLTEAKRYASEYGIRFLGGSRVAAVKWLR
jgi:hypothetical protein